MARWKLLKSHYLNVPGTEYDVRETHRETGKQVTKRFPVHLFLDPDDRSDHNYPADGLVIVSNRADKLHPRDIVFVGPPTPEMEPLDPEAEKISAEWKKKWDQLPIESLPTTMNQV
jgi:hypothetical protein